MVKPFFSGATKIFGKQETTQHSASASSVNSTSKFSLSKAPETSVRDHRATSVVSKTLVTNSTAKRSTKIVDNKTIGIKASVEPITEALTGAGECGQNCYGRDYFSFNYTVNGTNDFSSDVYDNDGNLLGNVALSYTNMNNNEWSWSNTQSNVVAVIMKSDAAQNRYVYDGTVSNDSGLYAPFDINGGSAPLRGITFCFNPVPIENVFEQVRVTSSATLECFKNFTYQVSCPTIEAQEVDQGQQNVVVPFEVTVKSVESGTNCNILGSIDITPNTQENLDFSASIKLFDTDGVEISSEGVFLVDPVEENGVIFVGFEGSFSLAPGKSFGKYTVTVVTSYDCIDNLPEGCVCPSRTQTVDGQITESSTTNVCPEDNDCPWVIKVSDSNLNNFTKNVLENCGIDKIYSFDLPFDAQRECGTYAVEVFASLLDCESQSQNQCSTSFTVDIVGCGDGGCTLTQGYWKTHSTCGPVDQKRDDAWDLLQIEIDGQLYQGESTPFFKSGATYCSVMWVKPKGLMYYVMARQYVAAVLNQLNGADSEAIGLALQVAEYLFTNYTPNQLKDLSNETITIELAEGGSITDTVGNLVDAVITTLTDYNEGVIGPGHCDGQDDYQEQD